MMMTKRNKCRYGPKGKESAKTAKSEEIRRQDAAGKTFTGNLEKEYRTSFRARRRLCTAFWHNTGECHAEFCTELFKGKSFGCSAGLPFWQISGYGDLWDLPRNERTGCFWCVCSRTGSSCRASGGDDGRLDSSDDGGTDRDVAGTAPVDPDTYRADQSGSEAADIYFECTGNRESSGDRKRLETIGQRTRDTGFERNQKTDRSGGRL